MIFIGMPSSGCIEPGAAKSLFYGATEREYTADIGTSSALTLNFNQLFVFALEMGATHFAMIHADVIAPTGWLDGLLAELEDTDADVMSGIIAIKDGRGLTTTALDTDRWRPRRLTMRELMAMPETLTGIPGIPTPLLINTGCWVCKLGPWAESFPGFDISNEIVKGPDGKRVVRFEPEDWKFSRWCHENGVRIAATRKVPLVHRGPANFPNSESWGHWSTDEENG